LKLVAEYRLQANDPDVISIFEADSVAPIMATLVEWGDIFEFTVIPAIPVEEGLQLAQRMKR